MRPELVLANAKEGFSGDAAGTDALGGAPPPAMQQGRYVNESFQIHAFDDPGWDATMST